MQIEEYFKENRKYIWLIGAVYLVVIAAILYFIWRPDPIKSNEIVKYNEKDYENLAKNAVTSYIQEIPFHLMLGTEFELEENISTDYLEYTDQTFESLMEDLKKDGYSSLDTHIKDLDTFILGDIYIYRGVLTSGSNTRSINIIEEYPYEYTISFDDFYKYLKPNKIYKVDGIEFKNVEQTNKLNSITYKLEITNTSNNYVKLLLDDETKIALKLTTGEIYYASMLINNTSKVTTLNKNSKTVKEMTFNVPLQLQEKLDKIIFKDVQSDGEEKDVEIVF